MSQRELAVTRTDTHRRSLGSFFALGVSMLVPLASGCGSDEQYAPVSGVVTLDGEPLADAKLIFEPIGDDEGTAAGKPSYGRTDEAGRYTLTSPIAEEQGAAVGPHRVRIVTMKAGEYTPEQMEAARAKLLREEEAGGGSPDNVTDERVREHLSDTTLTPQREMLPARYNSKTELTFTVPPQGTEGANFELESR